ncbi:MAG TPA: cupin domain-containing protein [Desulfuromonadaceae bacterium]|jgi:hypothetical protein
MQTEIRNSAYWISKLDLARHPEGGFFKESYRSAEVIPLCGLPERFDEERSFSTAIYFLLNGDDISALHRIKSDELWHFYDGVSLALQIIDLQGSHYSILLGRDLEKGEQLQAVVPAGCWFGAELADSDDYALVGCSVAPGFDFNDFELATNTELVALFPQHEALIGRLTRS